jgi:predicted site-specific integrase-resolvase
MGYQLLSVCQYCQPLAIVASSASCWINKKKEKDSTVYIDEALQLLGISYNTLKAWAKQGRVRRWKEEDGRWIYNDDDVYAMVGKKLAKDNWVVTYCRVAGTTESDRKLMADQQRVLHLWCAARGLSVDQQYEDWAPSTEYSLAERPGLHQLLQDIIQKRVSAVVVETPDRLARLGRELIEQICRYYGVQLVYVNKKIQRPEYLAEQEADLVRLLKAAKIDRLQDLGDQLPKPKKPKLPDPGKIVSDWEGAPLPKTSRELEQLGDLM